MSNNIKLLLAGRTPELMQEESIYNLIPKEYVQPPKGPRYKSKFPPNLPPTGSTFCHVTTSKPGVSNMSGEFMEPQSAHIHGGEARTMGHLKHARRPSPQNFRLKHTGTMGDNALPPVKNYSYDCHNRKDPVPKHNEKPVMGLRSNKNFIVTNAVQNILSVPKAGKSEIDWKQKPDFGKVPEYLSKIKDNIENEYRMIRNLSQEQEEDKKCMSEQEIIQLREALKKKWEQVNHEYQGITHISKVDTIGLKRKKETCEKELAQLERDIQKLNKMYVFVENRTY